MVILIYDVFFSQLLSWWSSRMHNNNLRPAIHPISFPRAAIILVSDEDHWPKRSQPLGTRLQYRKSLNNNDWGYVPARLSSPPQTLVFTKTAKLHYIRGKPAFCAWLAWWDLVLRWGLAFAKNLKILSSPFFRFCNLVRIWEARNFLLMFLTKHTQSGVKYYLLYP